MAFSLCIPLLTSRKSDVHSYDPLPALDEDTIHSTLERNDTRILPSSRRPLLLDPSFWLTALATLSIALTIRNLLLVQLQEQESGVTVLKAPLGSPYNGLEKLVRNESSPGWPLSSIHYPDFLGTTDGTHIRQSLNNGSLVQLDTDHTIVLQHRVRDFGLENCAVRLQLPYTKTGTTEGSTLMGDDLHLTLWRLDGINSVFSTSQLPFTLPSRKEFLGDISIDTVISPQSPFFRCSAQSVQTLEIAISCVSTPCSMQFHQTKPPQAQGFRIVQTEMPPKDD